MKTLKFTLRPLTPFGTPLAGDTLFGQLCWALALRMGPDRLAALLEGYTEGRPYAVVSDAFPAGCLPKPTLPDFAAGLDEVAASDRKAMRSRRWLPADQAHLPLEQWLKAARHEDAGSAAMLTQNTINRMTGTTGRGMFAPRQVEQIVFAPGTLLDVHVVHDPGRLSHDELVQALTDIGLGGFGRDASTGLGKYDITVVQDPVPGGPSAHAMALAPCAPAPEEIRPEACWWLPVTRFGRHGATAALGSGGGPFKKPVLLARTGAVIAWRTPSSAAFHGCGLGGAGQPISGVMPATVHQGYAPLVPINLETAT
jgi:CRISPR-associated protein Csm4